MYKPRAIAGVGTHSTAAPGPKAKLRQERAIICFPFVGDLIGGSHLSALGLIRNLDQERFTPLVLVQNGGGAIASLFHDVGIPTWEAPSSPHLPHGKRLAIGDLVGLAASIRPLSQMLRRWAVDIVHTNDGRSHATWALATRLAGSRLVWHHRGSADAIGLRYLAPLVADEVIAVSEYAIGKPPLLSSGTRRSVIHSPFDTTTVHDRTASRDELHRELGCPPGAHIVAFSGALIPRKRPILFVDAIAALRRARPDLIVHGAVFGEPIEIKAETVQRRAVELGIDDAIHVMGFRTPGARWLAACDALLVPAVDEPFGRTLVEAMLVGTPVVATRSGGNAEALRGGTVGLLVPPEDAGAMAEALASLLGDPDRSSVLSMRAQHDARARFGESQHAAQIMAVYDRLLARKGDTRDATSPHRVLG